MLRCVAGLVFSDVSNECSAFIFQRCKSPSHLPDGLNHKHRNIGYDGSLLELAVDGGSVQWRALLIRALSVGLLFLYRQLLFNIDHNKLYKIIVVHYNGYTWD